MLNNPLRIYQTRKWRAVRAFVLKRDLWRCVVCNADVSAVGAARVDHIKTVETHPELVFDPTNLRTLCVLHDNQSHREKGAWRSSPTEREERFTIKGVDSRGWPVDPDHSWITR